MWEALQTALIFLALIGGALGVLGVAVVLSANRDDRRRPEAWWQ